MQFSKKYYSVYLILFWTWQSIFAASVDTVLVYSSSMQRDIKAVVVIPENPAGQKTACPVIYLLHGYSGNYSDWAKNTNLRPLADRYGFIIVCPDGGYNSWYLDSPIDSASQYETHIIKEVIPFIKKQYAVLAEKQAVCGLSMGGHGALYLAAGNPGQFTAAGSISGGVDLTYSTKRWEISQKIGSYEEFPERWHKNSIINRIDQISKAKLSILIDCGVDDFFIDINRRLHQKLMKNNIDHEYIERPGKHSWQYWTNALEYHLLFFKKSFGRKK